MLYRYDIVDGGLVTQEGKQVWSIEIPEDAIVLHAERLGGKIRLALLVPEKED